MQPTQSLRVRQILSATDPITRTALLKLLPPKLTVPNLTTQPYPTAILSHFPKSDQYSLLGCLAEELLQKPLSKLTPKAICSALRRYAPSATDGKLLLTANDPTTLRFLSSLQTTRKALDAVITEPLQYNQVLQYDAVQGHPDGLTSTQVFEVKLTGYLKGGWQDFLLQTFAYAALQPAVQDIYIVLPLQEHVWHVSVSTWKHRDDFRTLLNAASKALQYDPMKCIQKSNDLQSLHSIGCHIQKKKTLVETVRGLPDPTRPYQIFLGNPQSSHLSISDSELAATSEMIAATGASIFVHTPYILNLCAPVAEDSWNSKLFQKYVQYSVAMGAKGVVIHVGKSTKLPLEEAMNNMTNALKRALEFATPECPVLLETPAGQGTETLKDMDAFIAYVLSFNDERLRICLDTCHVFACGYQPIECIQKMLMHKTLLKLVHYNDSQDTCGSCKDRHALVGTGHIGFEAMKQIAELCTSVHLPMVIE